MHSTNLLEVCLENVEMSQFGFEGMSLMEDERLESTLDLREYDDEAGDPEVVILTDRRVIHLNGNSKNRRASFASISDIDVVEIISEREGFGAFIWAGLAFFVAVMLWRVIDHPLGSAVAALIVALMGVYLIVDRLTSSGTPVLTFKAGTSEFRAELKGEQGALDGVIFINRLFQLKAEYAIGGYTRPGAFALR